MESEEYKGVGGSYVFMILTIVFVLPFAVSFLFCFLFSAVRLDVFWIMAGVSAFIIWMALLMAIGWGSFSRPFINRTAKKIKDLPYHFSSSFRGRGGSLYIDEQAGVIGYISAYNPFRIQVFSASRIDRIETIASSMMGIRFVFYLDGKKISMPTLLSNTVVSTTSAIGAEAISKADTYVEILKAAKARAEEKR